MATIKDVAKLANTSVATVSKTFNGYTEITPATKERIFEAAKKLNYVPNKHAVELSGRSSQYIGFIMQDLSFDLSSYEFNFKILSGLSKQCNTNNKELLIFTLADIKSKNMSISNFCKYHNLSGAVVHGLQVNDNTLDDIASSNIPILLVDMNLQDDKTCSISSCNYLAGSEVFNLLYRKGHRNIVYITGSDEAEISHLREKGFLAASSQLGSNCSLYKLQANFNEYQSYIKTKDFLSQNKDVTALFAFSDFMAIGASRAIKELGYTIGKDFSLIGFDGSEITNYTTPKIATVKQDFEQIGEQAIKTIISMSNGIKQENILIPFTIEEKESIHTI